MYYKKNVHPSQDNNHNLRRATNACSIPKKEKYRQSHMYIYSKIESIIPNEIKELYDKPLLKKKIENKTNML